MGCIFVSSFTNNPGGDTQNNMKLSELPSEKAQELLAEFQPDNGNSEVDELQIDSKFRVIAYGHRCTKPDCNCVGGWWEKTGTHPIGETFTVQA